MPRAETVAATTQDQAFPLQWPTTTTMETPTESSSFICVGTQDAPAKQMQTIRPFLPPTFCETILIGTEES